MTVNIRARTFDWDSDRPVQGIVRDEARDELATSLMHSVIEWIAALDVVAAGAWMCKWWYYGGYDWAYKLFYKMAPGFLNMVTTGQM